MFAMQANINLEHEQRLENVEKRLNAIEQEREENGKLLLSVSMSSEMLLRNLATQQSSSVGKQIRIRHKYQTARRMAQGV